MRVSQILPIKRRDLVSVAPSATVRSAIALMQHQRVGAVLLLDEEQRLLGVLSERDIVHGLATAALGLLERPVSEFAHTDAPVATPEDTVQSIMELMTVTRARHVPVVQFGRVVGIVSIGDIVKSRLDEKTLENVVLQEIARAQFFAG